MFQVNHEKGLTLSEVADGVSVEDVSSCTDEQTKKLTTLHFGAVFDNAAGRLHTAHMCTHKLDVVCTY